MRLSKSMEKSFRRLMRPSARHAFVEAEVVTQIAHQIRALRQQRGWSQLRVAKELGTTQAAISRLEDPSYGRVSLATLLALSKVFDVGLDVRFRSVLEMLRESRSVVFQRELEVESFEDEAAQVAFLDDDGSIGMSRTAAIATFVPSVVPFPPTVGNFTRRGTPYRVSAA